MLALTLRDKDYVFVYHRGTPIGAIFFGKERAAGRAKFPVQFNGPKDDFEILRPKAVEARYGKRELERLIREFGPEKSRECECGGDRGEHLAALRTDRSSAEGSRARRQTGRVCCLQMPINLEAERAAS